MSVWLTIPSARPPEQANPVLKKWRDQGYKIALWRDEAVSKRPQMVCDFMVADVLADIPFPYPGYAHAVNALIKVTPEKDPDAEWFVIGGDDVLPDPRKRAEQIAQECGEHFHRFPGHPQQTLGVMQPTGDRWGTNPHHPNPAMRTAYIDRVCGSAWIGREFAKRVYGGHGPLWHEYQHMFVDEELQRVAERLGVLWQRPDLTHLHQHWARDRRGAKPAHLAKWSSPAHWKEAETIFKRREAEGFKEAFVLA